MTWLDKVTNEMLANGPERTFAPSLLFDFDHVREAIAMTEEAIIHKQEKTQAERREVAMKAAQDPFHSYAKDPVSAPMAVALWDSALTFPVVLRRAMLIAICSHVEHVLKEWCGLLHDTRKLARTVAAFPKESDRESTLHRSMRYLRDEAGLALGKFEEWVEWPAIDAYRLARNCLAHNGGVVEREADVPKIAALPHVGVEMDGLLAIEATIWLRAGACEAAADTAKGFFERLVELCAQDHRAKDSVPAPASV